VTTCETHCYHGVGKVRCQHGPYAPASQRDERKYALRCCNCGRLTAHGRDAVDPSEVDFDEGVEP